MRVIAGQYRGLRLDAPDGDQTRPITDRVKESLFNVLTHRLGEDGMLPDVHVLDLFAGAGSYGIEALSRGAASCLFVERNRRTLKTLRANLARLHDAAATIATENVWSMRIPPAPDEGGYGLVFVDPPYRDVDGRPRVLDLLERVAPKLRPGGLLVFRWEVGSPVNLEDLQDLALVEERTWGRMAIALLGHPA